MWPYQLLLGLMVTKCLMIVMISFYIVNCSGNNFVDFA